MLLFLSLLLLRQAFVPAGGSNGAAATATAMGGQNRHIAKGLEMPAAAYLDSNTTATVILLPLESETGRALTDNEVIPPQINTCLQNTEKCLMDSAHILHLAMPDRCDTTEVKALAQRMSDPPLVLNMGTSLLRRCGRRMTHMHCFGLR